MIERLKIKEFNKVSIRKKLFKIKEIISVRIKPEKKPRNVLLGLILGKIFLLPNNDPEIKDIVSKHIINKTKYKNKVLS